MTGAFTGTRRPHADIDIAIFRRDVPALQEHLGSRFHLWSVGSGSPRPLLDATARTMLHDLIARARPGHAWLPWSAARETT